jgi:hypothetical protein
MDERLEALMPATYWVLISDELMNSEPRWESVGLDVLYPADHMPEPGGMRWWKIRDKFAGSSLEGQRVELEFGIHDGQALVVSRKHMAGQHPGFEAHDAITGDAR